MPEAKIVLTAVDQTKSAIDSVKSNLTSMGEAANLAQSMIGKITGALVGVGSVVAFKGMVDGVIATKVELARLSVQTGATVESLSAISSVAKLNGVDIDTVASAINKMQKNLASSDEKSKGAAQALKTLGINFKEFAEMPVDQQMLTLAKRLDEFQDGGGKAAVIMNLMNKNAAVLLPMFKDLAEYTELFGKQTTKSANEAEQYEKNLKRLEIAGNTWKRQMVDGMLPTLTAVTQAMVDARKQGGFLAMMQAGIQTLFTGNDQYKNDKALVEQTETLMALENAVQKQLKEGYGTDSRVVQNTLAQIASVREQIKTTMTYRKVLQDVQDVQDKADKARANRPKLPGSGDSKESTGPRITIGPDAWSVEVAKSYVETMADLAKIESTASAKADDLSHAQARLYVVMGSPQWNAYSRQMQEQIIYTASLAQTEEDRAAVMKAGEEIQRDVNRQLSEYANTSRELVVSANQRADQLQTEVDNYGKLKSAIESVTLAHLEESRGLAALAGEDTGDIDKRIAAQKRLIEALKKQELIDLSANLASSIESGIMSGFAEGHTPVDIFLEELKSQFSKTVLRPMIQPIAEAGSLFIQQGLKSIFGFADGGVMSSAGPMPLKAYAGGGIADRPQLALFGEGRMNEAFVPLPDGRSIPVSMNATGRPSIVNNITISANVGDVASKSDVVAGMRATANNIIAQISRSQRYGGALA